MRPPKSFKKRAAPNPNTSRCQRAIAPPCTALARRREKCPLRRFFVTPESYDNTLRKVWEKLNQWGDAFCPELDAK
jgi:hypothetical protein